MRELDVRRQRDSAQHYLTLDTASSALETTLWLASQAVGLPVAMLTIVNDCGQHIIASTGYLDIPRGPHPESLCHTVVSTGEPLIIADVATSDWVTASGSLLDSAIRTYIGVPLTGREGLVVGTLCLVDVEQREIDPRDVSLLFQFVSVAEEQLDRLRRLGPPLGSANELRGAIDAGQIVPWFQPVVELERERIIGYEALARWQHPSRGLLQPGEFIPLAEDSELIIDFDLAMLRQVTQVLAGWQLTDPELNATVSVNLSARHFRYDECVDRLYDAATSTGVLPESIVFELTETSAFSADDKICGFLSQLRDRGFRVLLDDFGTGWSTLEHLTHLPTDGVKIDHSTSSMLGTQVGDAVIRAVAALARELGKTTIIEGIESPAQAALARSLGCTHAQGFLWSAAMHADALLL